MSNKSLWLCTLMLLTWHAALANDTSGAFAAGGIVFEKNSSVAMEREDLYISKDMVRVDYVFQNVTSQDVNVLVAFPVPDHRMDRSYFELVASKTVINHAPPFLDDFKANVDGKPVAITKNVQAFHHGQDVTSVLKNLGLAIDRFGGHDPGTNPNMGLAPKDLAALRSQRLIEGKENWPTWEVRKIFTWRQVFPAKTPVQVTHTYKPIVGYEAFYESSPVVKSSQRACLDKPIKGPVATCWVQYILRTARNWRGPIGFFRLTVEPSEQEIVGFCWVGAVQKKPGGVLVAERHNFLPEQDIDVVFFTPISQP